MARIHRKSRNPRVLPELGYDHPAEARWSSLFGTKPPRSRFLMVDGAAWQEQVIAIGDVSSSVRLDLALAATEIRNARGVTEPTRASQDLPRGASSTPLPSAASQLLPGSRLVKVHGGKTHVVEITADGMVYDGQTYASLSAVAKVITGTHWNGLLFFGLRKRRTYPAKAKVAANG